MIFYYAGILFTITMAVMCVRRGQTHPWIWIILLFPTVGAAVYLFAEVLGTETFSTLTGRRASKRELKHAEAEVRRLDNADAWTHFAQVLRSRSQFEQAKAAASSAVDKDPDNWHALYELGLAHMGLEDYAAAVAPLERVVELEPAYAKGEASFALAVSLQESGRKEEARRLLTELARTTSRPEVLFRLAALQADAGETARARESLERIIHEAEFVPSYHRRKVRPWVRRAKKALSSLPTTDSTSP